MVVASESLYGTSVQTELQKRPQIRAEVIADIQKWLATQPHMPPIFDIQIAHFLHASYYDVDVAKDTIEHYYTYKSSMTEFFSDWDPMSKTLSDYAKNVIESAFLPKLSPDDSQVIVLRLKDSSLDLYNFNRSVKWLLMSVTSQLLSDGQQKDYKLVYDATGYSMSHVMRNPLAGVKNYLDFGQKASAIRVVEIHFINSSSVVKRLISIVKPFMNKQIMKMLSFHTTSDGFFKDLPTEQVPSDYGGTGPSIATLHEENTKRVQSLQESLIIHSQQKTDETKRLGKKEKKKVEADFKKLELD